jgi:hypothetical protein
MKNLLCLLLIGASMLHSGHALSQETVIRFPAACASSDNIAEAISKFDESPAMTMISQRTQESGPGTANYTLLFINYETKSWTLIERMADDVFCVIAAGTNIAPYVKKQKQ